MPDIEQLREAAEHSNVQAFLRAIRLGEGTSDDEGYSRLVGGGSFEGFDKHPEKSIYLPRYNVWSTAAGAYQFLSRTWKGLVAQYGFEDFSPENQDLGAIALIAEKDALTDVMCGRLEEAVKKCNPIWASLPGAGYGQREEHIARVTDEYEKWGGTFA